MLQRDRERGRARSGTGPCFSVIGNAVGLVRERGLASA